MKYWYYVFKVLHHKRKTTLRGSAIISGESNLFPIVSAIKERKDSVKEFTAFQDKNFTVLIINQTQISKKDYDLLMIEYLEK